MSQYKTEIEGEKVWYSVVSGAVAAEKKWSETHISGGGGGGSFSQGYGVVNPVIVSSRVVTRQEFWVVGDDGREYHVNTPQDSWVEVRDGQRVTLAWGAKVGLSTGPYILLREHNTGLNKVLFRDCKGLIKKMDLKDPSRNLTLIFLGGLVAIPVLIGPFVRSFLVSLLHRRFDYIGTDVVLIICLFIYTTRATGKQRLAKWNRVISEAAQAIANHK